MRARRLRRLGLIGGSTNVNAGINDIATTDSPQTLDENNSPIPSVSNKSLASQVSDEFDENQHKQKVLKFDNESVTMAIEKNIVNNNDTGDGSLARSASNLTQRSRLLSEYEQKIQNSLNQNIENIETGSNNKMETDDNTQMSHNNVLEGDSGIENMEIDEPMPPTKVQVEVEVDLDAKQREAEISISRILDAFWIDHCEGENIATATAECYKDFFDAETNEILFDDLAFQIITEVIIQYFDGKRVDYKASAASQNLTSTPIRNKIQKSDTASNIERMDTTESTSTCATPNMQPHNLPDQGACTYLIQCYTRSTAELDRYSSSKNQKRFGTYVHDVVCALQEQLINTTVLILNGKMEKKTNGNGVKINRSVLLDLLYEESIPFDFLHRLVSIINNNDEDSLIIFGLLLSNLLKDMQTKVTGRKQNNKIDTTSVNILRYLTEITVNTSAGTVVRPFCNLIVKIVNFLPNLCTDTTGREVVKASFLGPFLSISVFSEENPKLFEDEDDDWDVNSGIAVRLQSVILHYYQCYDFNFLFANIYFFIFFVAIGGYAEQFTYNFP